MKFPTTQKNCYEAVVEYIRVIGPIIFMIPVLFFRDSMLLSGLSVVLAIILRCLTSTSEASPRWVNEIISWTLSFRPGQLLVLTNPSAEVIHSFIHSVFCLTTGSDSPPKHSLHIVRSRASSFK